jgi:hypothetical protein
MDLTAMQWLMVVFSAVIGIAVAIGLERFLRREVSAVPRMLMAVVAFLGISALLSGLLVSPIGQAIGISRPTAPTPTPGPIVQNEGYVMSVVTDKYAVPSAPLAGATVSVSLTRPSPGAAIFPVASGTTNSQGACFFRIPGMTSGTVYVIATNPNYYSAVAQTVIPGAQVYPSEALWAKIALAKVGTLSLTFENLTPDITYDSETGTITLDSSRTLQEFRLTITTSAPMTAIKDPAVMLVRASTWASNNPTVSVTVEDSGGLSVSQAGNINTSVSQNINGAGDLTADKVLKLRFRIVLTPSAGSNLMSISLDDLLGGVGYAGETGISPTWINVAVSS